MKWQRFYDKSGWMIKLGYKGSIGGEGQKGDPGEAATVTVGDTSTLPAGENATVSNAGDSQDAVLDFGIPKGEKGDTGKQGPKGDTGEQGPKGDPGETPTIPDADGITAAPVGGGTATDVQGILEELNARIETLESA